MCISYTPPNPSVLQHYCPKIPTRPNGPINSQTPKPRSLVHRKLINIGAWTVRIGHWSVPQSKTVCSNLVLRPAAPRLNADWGQTSRCRARCVCFLCFRCSLRLWGVGRKAYKDLGRVSGFLGFLGISIGTSKTQAPESTNSETGASSSAAARHKSQHRRQEPQSENLAAPNPGTPQATPFNSACKPQTENLAYRDQVAT